MEDMEAYLRQQSTDWLKTVLRADFAGIAFPVESVFLVCKILAEREPPSRTPEEAYQEFLRHYCPKTEDL